VCTMVSALAHQCARYGVVVEWMSDRQLAQHCQGPSIQYRELKDLFPLRLRVALRGERNKDADSVSISLATQRNAQP